MADRIISQGEADYLVACPKTYEGPESISYPIKGGSIEMSCRSLNGAERFKVDVSRSRIELKKVSHQLRVRVSIPLFRIEINASPHKNPDYRRISGNHVHVYTEGYGLSWAYEFDEVPEIMSHFNDMGDLESVLSCFLDYCQVRNKPTIMGELF